MGPLPKWCEPFGARQGTVLFVVLGLLSDAAKALDAGGRSRGRSAESAVIGVAMELFERFINAPSALVSVGYPPLPLTRRQRHVVRALRFAVGLGADGFRQWWERDELNRRFPSFRQFGIGLRFCLAGEFLDRVFPNCAPPRRVVLHQGTVEALRRIELRLTDLRAAQGEVRYRILRRRRRNERRIRRSQRGPRED